MWNPQASSVGHELALSRKSPWGQAGVRARRNAECADWCGCGTREFERHGERVWVDNLIRLVNAYNRMGLKVQRMIDLEDLRF